VEGTSFSEIFINNTLSFEKKKKSRVHLDTGVVGTPQGLLMNNPS
jgi:hypothetical protein